MQRSRDPLRSPQAQVLHAQLHVKGRLGKACMAGCQHRLCHAGCHPPLTYFEAGCCCHADRIGGGLLHGLIASHSADAQKPQLWVMPCNVSDKQCWAKGVKQLCCALSYLQKCTIHHIDGDCQGLTCQQYGKTIVMPRITI